MLKLVKYCALFSVIGTIDCNLHIAIPNVETKDQIANCIEKIIEHARATDPVRDITLVNFNSSFETSLLHLQSGLKLLSRSFHWRKNTLTNTFYVIKIQNYEELQRSLKLLKKDYFWNPRAKIIIVIKNLRSQIILLSNLLTYYNMYNVTVLSPTQTDQDLYAFRPELNNCGKPLSKIVQLVTKCSNLNESANIFPFRKVDRRKLRGCKLRILNHNYWPFLSLKKRKVVGVSQFQLQLWSEFAGVVIELIDYEKDEDFGRVSDDYVTTGMLHLLEDHKIHIATGGYAVTFDRAKVFEYAYPYTIDHSEVIVFRAGFESSWRAVIIQFTLYSTLVIGLYFTFFMFAAVRFSIFEKKKKDVTRDMLIVFGYFCSNTYSKNMTTNSSLRMIVCCMLIFVFFLTFLIQAYLLSATTDPIRKYQIRHLDEALSTCKPFKSWMWQTSFDPTRVAPLDCDVMSDCLPKMKDRRNENLFTVLSKTFYDAVYWNFVDENGEPEFVPAIEPVTSLMRSIYFRKGSTTIGSFEKMFQISMMSGLAKKNLDDIVFEVKLRRVNKIGRDQSPAPENLNEFGEIFVVLLIGYFLATITFVFENKSRLRSLFNSKLA